MDSSSSNSSNGSSDGSGSIRRVAGWSGICHEGLTLWQLFLAMFICYSVPLAVYLLVVTSMRYVFRGPNVTYMRVALSAFNWSYQVVDIAILSVGASMFVLLSQRVASVHPAFSIQSEKSTETISSNCYGNGNGEESYYDIALVASSLQSIAQSAMRVAVKFAIVSILAMFLWQFSDMERYKIKYFYITASYETVYLDFTQTISIDLLALVTAIVMATLRIHINMTKLYYMALGHLKLSLLTGTIELVAYGILVYLSWIIRFNDMWFTISTILTLVTTFIGQYLAARYFLGSSEHTANLVLPMIVSWPIPSRFLRSKAISDNKDYLVPIMSLVVPTLLRVMARYVEVVFSRKMHNVSTNYSTSYQRSRTDALFSGWDHHARYRDFMTVFILPLGLAIIRRIARSMNRHDSSALKTTILSSIVFFIVPVVVFLIMSTLKVFYGANRYFSPLKHDTDVWAAVVFTACGVSIASEAALDAIGRQWVSVIGFVLGHFVSASMALLTQWIHGPESWMMWFSSSSVNAGVSMIVMFSWVLFTTFEREVRHVQSILEEPSQKEGQISI
ncbi:hypothetical protein GQ42DRAFT_164389 [Ramicandelaber brevisporus]|nr:hypothetical protein GQ42DRAFT_164389 [Ramicandelaber brevisporus]